jgi:hypothetical protein
MKAFVPVLLSIVLSSIAIAQIGSKHEAEAAPPPAAAAPVVPEITDTVTAYLLTDAEKLKIRDAQLEWQEIESENLREELAIEKNKARQKEISDSVQVLAFQLAQEKKIPEVSQWEIDRKQLKFVKKKAATK